jgi:hypothetical protein
MATRRGSQQVVGYGDQLLSSGSYSRVHRSYFLFP